MAAATLPASTDTVLFDGGPRLGRKLLLSGSGRCNLSHAGGVEDFIPRYGRNGRFLVHALHALAPASLVQFFATRGVSCETREDGKIFPASEKARDILAALIDAARGKTFKTETHVLSISRSSRGFSVITEGGDFPVDRIILAAGGLSYPETGSTGDGFAMAEALGHVIIPPRPALTAVVSPGFGALSGNTFTDVEAAVFRDGKIVVKNRGSLLFTHKGVSGPVILDLSRYVREGDIITVNFLFPRNPEEFLLSFQALIKQRGGEKIVNFLADFPVTRALINHILESISMGQEKRCADLTKSEIRRTAEGLVRFPVPVTTLEGWRTAMVTSGGVDLRGVNPKTMESRSVPGLFFAGEVLDIDGDTGGYNLQAAFSTGYLAARSCL
jgi:hypothetical protein